MDDRNTFVEGMIAGALGYLAVAGVFAALNAVTGQSPFQTAYLLGEALGAQASGRGATAGVILAANGVHVVVSLTVGVAAAWLLMELEHHHAIWYAVLLAFLGGFFLSIVMAGVLMAEASAVATWPQVTLANTVAAGVIGAWLWWRHRALLSTLRTEFAA